MKPDAVQLDGQETPSIRCFADRRVIERGQRFLGRLISALRIAQIYDPGNDAFLKHSGTVYEVLRILFRTEGEALIEVAAGHLFFNGVRMPVGFTSYSSHRFLTDSLTQSGVGKIWFEEDLDKNELGRFLHVFSRSVVRASQSCKNIEADLCTEGISNIHIGPLQDTDTALSALSAIRQVGKQMYLNSISLLEKMTDNLQPKQKIRAKIARRLAQTIVDAVINDEAYMLALTNIKNHNDYTLNHSVNVCVLSVALGYRLGIERTRLADLGISALFHDIGKVNIPRDILMKRSRLTAKELEIVKKHPYQGAAMLTRIKGLGSLPVRAIIVAMEHHLGADLSGYPKVTKRKAVNLFSRMISIADVFDAMTTSRVYREKAFTGDEAIAEMMKESGTKFDPLLLKAFTQMLGIFPVGTAVLLNTGELAVVIETNHDPSCQRYPTIKLIVDDAGRRKDGPIIDLASQNDVVDSVTRKIVKSVDAHYYRVDVTNYL